MSEVIKQLQDEIQSAKEWRIKELALIKKQLSFISNPLNDSDQLYLRMSCLIVYSHSEGYVKEVLKQYIETLKKLKIPHKNLEISMVVLSISERFGKAETINNEKRHEFVELFIDLLEKPFPDREIIVDAKSNLNIKTLELLCKQYCLNPSRFNPKFKDLDHMLGIRNCIAHGETHIPNRGTVSDYIQLVEGLMDDLEEEILDVISQEKYLKNNKTISAS